MKILYIILGYLINHSNSKCDELKIQQQVSCYQFTKKCCILEGNEDDYQQLQHINTQIVEKSIQIPYQEEPILIRVISSLNQYKIQQKLMCSLFANLEYYITCMAFDLILYEEQTNYSEYIRINTKILANNLCDELFTMQDGFLSLFCLGQTTLKQYSLDFSRNVILSFEYDVSDQIEDKCKKKQIKWKDNQYLVVFYQCSRWKVLLIKNNQSSTLLDSSMKHQDVQLSRFSFIDYVTYCESNNVISNIYLIEDNFYLQVFLNQHAIKHLNFVLIEYPIRIQKILIQSNCQLLILVNQLDLLIQSQQESQVILNQQYPINNIHFYSNLIFLQNQFELDVLISAQINQTYQICNTSLHFFETNNLFCQFDNTKKVLQFYKYQPLPTIIKPKQKYIFIIQKKQLFRKGHTSICYRVLYYNHNQKAISQFIELIIFQNNCQQKYQTLWKSEYSVNNGTFNLNSSDGSINVNIRKYENIHSTCLTRLYTFYFQDKFELKDIISQYICFQYESIFYIYDCEKDKFSISINLNQYNVLQSRPVYYFVNRNNNSVLRGVNLLAPSISLFNIYLNEVITSFEQISQYIFFQVNNSDLPLIIQMNYLPYSRSNYLSKDLYQPEPILFYFDFENIIFIQYPQILAIKSKEILRCYEIQEQLIISIQELIHPSNCYIIVAIQCDYKILTLQNQPFSLIIHYFEDYQIHQIYNYTFQDYQFYYPFTYTINLDSIALLIKKNNLLYIAIFQYDVQTVSLYDIIATDNSFFKCDLYRLLFSYDKVWMYLLLKNILVEFETESLHQNTLSSNFSMKLKELDESELRISIQNQCFKVYSIIKSPIFEIQQNQSIKLHISDIFYGPITNLTLINNSNIILKGPYQFKQELLNCNDETSILCYKVHYFQKQIEQFIFTVIMQDNQVIEVFQSNFFDRYYVTWVKWQYYLYVSQLLNVELIECSEKQYEPCKLISKISDNFGIEQINIADTTRVGNLIKLQGDNTQAFIFIDDINFNIQLFSGIFIDIQYIEKSKDQYLFLQKNMKDTNELELAIYSINLNQKHQIYSLAISEKIQRELIKNGNLIKQIVKMKLVSCKYTGEQISIKLVIMDQFCSQLFQLNLDQQKNQIEFELQKQVRNSMNLNSHKSENIIIQHIDDQLLIQKDIESNLSSFYDLLEDRIFYDYFHQSIISMQIKRFNTTNFIFIDCYKISIGTIGYELELQNYNQIEQNFQLFAENEISNDVVSLQIHIIQSKQKFTHSILIIQISCFIFIIIYTRKTQSKSGRKKQSGN
ncbi:unnamed protein product [Paramecium octaurelia]|uniref:Transmembrane protein n=1 Tax=Paramecium octaurelia TaxID=43137 RepID=A0A8S1YNH7_PAROT|nr:unnamed protein product [Paramecium octaurelia]